MSSISFICVPCLLNSWISTDQRSIYQVEWSAHSLASGESSAQMFVAHCGSAIAGANDSHFAKDSSSPGRNTAVIGRNLSLVREITVI
jgi:hypothetical protein